MSEQICRECSFVSESGKIHWADCSQAALPLEIRKFVKRLER